MYAGKIIELHKQFDGRAKVSLGWGTMLTNDFQGLTPFPLEYKAVAAYGRPTVKLSDNPNKAMGPEPKVARCIRMFSVGKQLPLDVVV